MRWKNLEESKLQATFFKEVNELFFVTNNKYLTRIIASILAHNNTYKTPRRAIE